MAASEPEVALKNVRTTNTRAYYVSTYEHEMNRYVTEGSCVRTS